jgi:hypothetical protein
MFRLQKHISLLLLMVFMTAQAMVLHSFAHDDHDTSCDLCIVIQHTQQQPFLLVDAVVVSSNPDFIDAPVLMFRYAFAKADTTPLYYSVRPPPFSTR